MSWILGRIFPRRWYKQFWLWLLSTNKIVPLVFTGIHFLAKAKSSENFPQRCLEIIQSNHCHCFWTVILILTSYNFFVNALSETSKFPFTSIVFGWWQILAGDILKLKLGKYSKTKPDYLPTLILKMHFVSPPRPTKKMGVRRRTWVKAECVAARVMVLEHEHENSSLLNMFTWSGEYTLIPGIIALAPLMESR